MKKLFGVAVVGAACLLGCKTDTAAAGHSSEVGLPTRVAQNPLAGGEGSLGEGGAIIQGTVVADYRDSLIIEDENGAQRSVRIQENTLYRDGERGKMMAREYLEPGSEVRASFNYNDKERVAQEVIVVQDANNQCEPNAWPEEPSPYRRDP